RAAFAGLGYLAGIVTFAIIVTAVKFNGRRLLLLSFTEQIAIVWHIALPLALALIVPVAIVLVGSNLAPTTGPWRLIVVGAMTLAAVGVCLAMPAFDIVLSFDRVPRQLATLMPLFASVLEFRHRAATAAAALLRGKIDAVAASAQLQQARLQVLRAQIAPHF